MGVSMNPRYYDPIYIPPSRYHYPPPSRIIYINPSMNGMAPLPPQFVPIPPNQRIMYAHIDYAAIYHKTEYSLLNSFLYRQIKE